MPKQEKYTPSLEHRKSFCVSEVMKMGDNLRLLVLSGTTPSQREAWSAKGRIASNVLKNSAHEAEIATIQLEADARGKGETVEQLAQKQFEKSLRFMTINNTIEALTSKANDAIDGCENEEELEITFKSILDQEKLVKSKLLS